MITSFSAPCLLVAMPGMNDSNFSQTVLLLAEHNPEGAIAFILNRPSTMSLKSMVSNVDREVPEAIPAWYGGPVDTATAIILHDRRPSEGDTEVAPGIHLSSTGRLLDALIDHDTAMMNDRPNEKNQSSTKHSYRFLVGYAGWKGGQLDDELRAGVWLMTPLDRKVVFDTPWDEIWQECIQRVGMRVTSATPLPVQNVYLN